MGCTSSAANMPETQSSTTDNTENNITREDSKEPIKENDIIYSNTKELDKRQTQVLPECEIKNNQMQIASEDNNKSIGNNFNMEKEDTQDITPTKNHGDDNNMIESSPLNDNFVSLKVVVEKVISEHTDEHEQISNVIESRNEAELDRQIEEIIAESNASEGAEHEHNEDEAKDSPSPTQSEDSRATRWEALADIAAELPPSLAVDPLTGQIYSLTK